MRKSSGFAVICVLVSLVAGGSAATPPSTQDALVFHAVYYHTVQGSFWAQLADDTGESPTPRELAIASIGNNFKAIKALGFDTVTIALPDNDGWNSQRGSGFSYDPANPVAAEPQYAVAQEIVARIADADQLKIIFEIQLTPYRFSSDGRPEWAGMADEYGSTSNPRGAYDFIHGLIDPTLYYGARSTTKLSTIGMKDGTTRSFIGDPRIVGWQLSGEWNHNVINGQSKIGTQQRGFARYWNFFYKLVHYQGANNAFAGTYLIGSPDSRDAQVNNIKAFKQWFAPGTGITAPDMVGLEFYGGTAEHGYDLTSISGDLSTVIDAMEKADPGKYPGDFAIPSRKIYLAEGNANQVGTPAVNQYFQDVFKVLTDGTLGGIQFFVSDTLADATDLQKHPTLSSALPIYDLFVTTYSATGTRTYPRDLPPGVSWHLNPGKGDSYADPTNYRAVPDSLPASYGKWSYSGPTDIGRWLQQAITTHAQGRNLRFYASPNPIQFSAGTHSTLHWDLSDMAGVKSVEVRAGSIDGSVINTGQVKNTLAVPINAAGSQDFVLVDVTAGAHRLLGTVTLEAK